MFQRNTVMKKKRRILSVLIFFCTVVTFWYLKNGVEISNVSVSSSKANAKAQQQRHIVSFLPRGRLCNIVCEYVHLLHTNITFTKEAYVHPKMYRYLSRLFASFPLPLLPEPYRSSTNEPEIPYYDALARLERGSPLPHFTLLKGAPCRISLLWSIREYWREKLVFKHQLKVTAEERLKQLLLKNILLWPVEETKAVVGVHVRRGDFTDVMQRRYDGKMLLPPAYYHSAFSYYRQRFGREVIFIILTEESEREWCREFLSSNTDDVIVPDDGASAEQDLVQLSMSQHIVYSHGTYGLWGILLSNAQTVVYPDKISDAGQKRYSHHEDLDLISDKVPGTEFVTVSF